MGWSVCVCGGGGGGGGEGVLQEKEKHGIVPIYLN